jgi:Holliday junction resolvase
MSKRKGMNAERELIHKFWAINGWFALRVAGSGSMRYPSPDIVAGHHSTKILLECKATKGPAIYVPHEEIDDLLAFARRFGANAYIAARFDREPWSFIPLQDLRLTDKNYVFSQKMAGLSFDELVHKHTPKSL